MKNKIVKAIIISIVVIVIGVGGYVGYTKVFNVGNKGAPNGARTGGNQRNSEAMTTAYSTVLKALVAEKTITQEQANRVLVAATENMQGGGGQGGEPGGEPGGRNGGGEKPTSTEPADGELPRDAAQEDGARPKNDNLSELIASKVITQEQADTINQKLQEAMKSARSTTIE